MTQPLQVEERHRQRAETYLSQKLGDRGGFRHLLGEIEESDPDTYREIVTELALSFAEAEAAVTEAVERREREHYFPLIAALRRIESWTATDLKENGPGPSGGFQLRLDFVRGVLAKAAQSREGGQEER